MKKALLLSVLALKIGTRALHFGCNEHALCCTKEYNANDQGCEGEGTGGSSCVG